MNIEQHRQRLRVIEKAGRLLLDQIAVPFASNLGNTNSDDWHNPPLMFAGGRPPGPCLTALHGKHFSIL